MIIINSVIIKRALVFYQLLLLERLSQEKNYGFLGVILSFLNTFEESSLVVELNSKNDKNEAFIFLESMGLKPDSNIDFIYGIKVNNQIVATGGAYGKVIKYLAVHNSFQGEGLAAKVVTAIIDRLAENGIHHQFIYTKPKTATLLSSMGFTTIGEIEGKVTLLEGGMGTITSWCNSLEKFKTPAPSAAVVVVNGNPLTKGHLHLLKTALKNEGALHILVVSTEKSLFPTAVRVNLIKNAVKDWKNTIVHEAGEYIVSMATFPSYFTREETVAKLQAHLDIEIFASHIVPALSIGSRYVGEEPYCAVTALYNEAMKEILPSHGVKFVQIPRIESGNLAISASRVRQLLRENISPEKLVDILPQSTVDFLRTSQGREIIKRIQSSESRH